MTIYLKLLKFLEHLHLVPGFGGGGWGGAVLFFRNAYLTRRPFYWTLPRETLSGVRFPSMALLCLYAIRKQQPTVILLSASTLHFLFRFLALISPFIFKREKKFSLAQEELLLCSHSIYKPFVPVCVVHLDGSAPPPAPLSFS